MPTIQDIQLQCKILHSMLNSLPNSRELATAKTKLDECFMWAISAEAVVVPLELRVAA